jgi:hypothetical protein
MKKELVMLAAIASIIMVFATISAHVYPEGMVSYWKLDEGSGITAFDSVGTNDGTLVNGPDWKTGQVGGALEFYQSDYVSIPDDASLNPSYITVEAWIYPTSYGYYRSIVAKRYYSGWSYPYNSYILCLRQNTANPAFAVAVDGKTANAVSEDAVSMDAWSHLVGTYDGETIKIYVNRVLVGTNTELIGSIDKRSYPLYIGHTVSTNNYYYGKIDEVAIYNRALTPEEIQQHYQNGLNGLGYEELVVPATIDINPDTLNVKSNGEWITAYIELPTGYDVNGIYVSTINLEHPSFTEPIPVDSSAPATVGDYDIDGIFDLMVKFDRTAVVAYLGTEDVTEDETGTDYYEELTLTGELTDGTPFEGSDTIRVIDKGKGK